VVHPAASAWPRPLFHSSTIMAIHSPCPCQHTCTTCTPLNPTHSNTGTLVPPLSPPACQVSSVLVTAGAITTNASIYVGNDPTSVLANMRVAVRSERAGVPTARPPPGCSA
jgi:hypothetical protein